MSAATSEGTGRVYGIRRVCSAWYAQTAVTRPDRAPPAKRGPKTAISDEALVAASPFTGAGYRKVWAKLRAEGIRTGKSRVLRLMGAHRLLVPGPDVGGGLLDDGHVVRRQRGGVHRGRPLHGRAGGRACGGRGDALGGIGADPAGGAGALRADRREGRQRAAVAP